MIKRIHAVNAAAFCIFVSACAAPSITEGGDIAEVDTPWQAETVNWDQTTDDINRLVERYNAPSAAVAVISVGEIVYAQSFGLQEIETHTPASLETMYAVGSISKTFTSALIGTLENEGKLALTDHPSRHVHDLQFRSEELSANLSVANLLSQTSGLPRLDGSYVFFPEKDQVDLAPRFLHFGASCRVGDCWSYNNMNFIMLDMIAESVTGQSKSQMLMDKLLVGAGMKSTVSSTEAFSRSANAATGYTKTGDDMRPAATEYLFGEQVYATASDMARWLNLWMTEGGGIIPADYVQRAISMQAIENGSAPSKDEPGAYLFGYGYGWSVKSVEGNFVVHHGGNENGFSAQILFVPASGIGVVTLTNQQDSILPYVVNDLLLRRNLSLPETGVDEYPVVVGTSAPLLSDTTAKLNLNRDAPFPLELTTLPGRYSAPGYGTIEIRLDDDVLKLRTPAADFVLSHREGTVFSLGTTESVPMGINLDFFEVTFEEDSLSMNLASEPVVFEKSDAQIVR